MSGPCIRVRIKDDEREFRLKGRFILDTKVGRFHRKGRTVNFTSFVPPLFPTLETSVLSTT